MSLDRDTPAARCVVPAKIHRTEILRKDLHARSSADIHYILGIDERGEMWVSSAKEHEDVMLDIHRSHPV